VLLRARQGFNGVVPLALFIALFPLVHG
jgi:hypothetical protein